VLGQDLFLRHPICCASGVKPPYPRCDNMGSFDPECPLSGTAVGRSGSCAADRSRARPGRSTRIAWDGTRPTRDIRRQVENHQHSDAALEVQKLGARDWGLLPWHIWHQIWRALRVTLHRLLMIIHQTEALEAIIMRTPILNTDVKPGVREDRVAALSGSRRE
jgi:hypothetical protein